LPVDAAQVYGIDVIAIGPGAVATPIWDKASTQSAEIRDRLPEAAHQLYRHALTRMEAIIGEQQRSGIPPRRVADAVTHALTAARPKTRYLLGRDAMVIARLRRILPDRVWDRFIARATGLPTHADA
jgi:NAD(P)-dependent dehydrogenase (short-subunit alcohol dehydrogenase family)